MNPLFQNREEWENCGQEVVASMLQRLEEALPDVSHIDLGDQDFGSSPYLDEIAPLNDSAITETPTKANVTKPSVKVNSSEPPTTVTITQTPVMVSI